MGNQSSKKSGRQWSLSSLSAPLELIDRSNINDNDLIANLRWSLSESMRWDERAIAVKDIICVEGSEETNNLSKSQQEERYQATLELLDNVLHDGSSPVTGKPSSASTTTKAKESVKSLFTTKSGEQGGTQQRKTSDVPSSASLKDKPATTKSPPSSGIQGYATTLLPPSSSKLFAAAACKFVNSSISQGSITGERSSWLGGETRSKASQAMSGGQKSIASTASQMTGGAGGISGGGGIPPIGQESNVLPSEVTGGKGGISSMTAFPHDDIVEKYHSESMNERIEIACKYIYLSSLMKSLSHSTAWCYQLHEKIKWFNNCINDLSTSITKGNRQQYTHAELHKKQMELAKDRVYSLLQDGLKSHDRWRCVLRLLYRDFELCMARHKLQTENARWFYHRDNDRSAIWTRDELEGKINTLNAQKQPIDLEVEKNERDALSCGLAFLDKNLSGSLEAEETPELNAKLFRMLDMKHRAAISYTDLHEGVLSIQDKLEGITAQIQILQQQNEQLRQRSSYSSYQSTATTGISSTGDADSAVIVQNEAEIEQLKRASVEHWNNLQQIYTAFFTAFAQSVFPSVELNEIDTVQNQVLANGDQIVQIIDHISKMSVTDPLISMQTKLQRGDISLTSQASLDASIIAQSQQSPVPSALQAAQTAPLTIPMALAGTPAAQHRPPSTFEQTTKPKSATESMAAEKAVDASKRELGREKQIAEHPAEITSIHENIPGIKDARANVLAARDTARERAAEMRSSQMENVPKRTEQEMHYPAGEDRTITRLVPQTIHIHEEPKGSSKGLGTQTEREKQQNIITEPTIHRQTPLQQTRTTATGTGTDYEEQPYNTSTQQDINPQTAGQSWTEKVSSSIKSAFPASLSTPPPSTMTQHHQQKDVPPIETKYQGGPQWSSVTTTDRYPEEQRTFDKGTGTTGEQQWSSKGDEENISGRDYVEKPSFGMASEQGNIPPSSVGGYQKYQQQTTKGGLGEERYQQPSATETKPIESQYEKQIGYGAQGAGGQQEEEEYFTPATTGTEKGGYSQQKQTQFAADPSLTTTERERSDTIPQSPERQSQSWTESIKNTVRSVTGAGAHTSTH